MDSVKYIGMDVHKEATSIADLNSSGKLVMECTIETKASTVLDFLKGVRGSLRVTLEEGTWAGHILEHVTLELQTQAGRPAGFGRARRRYSYCRGVCPATRTGRTGRRRAVVHGTQEVTGRAAVMRIQPSSLSLTCSWT